MKKMQRTIAKLLIVGAMTAAMLTTTACGVLIHRSLDTVKDHPTKKLSLIETTDVYGDGIGTHLSSLAKDSAQCRWET